MSRPVRTKTPTWKASALSDVSQATATSTRQQPQEPLQLQQTPPAQETQETQQPQQPQRTQEGHQSHQLPAGTPPIQADDALGRVSTALRTGLPTLHELQDECEELLKASLSFKHDVMLQISSIFNQEEILSKFTAAHPENPMSLAGLTARLRDAKTKLAWARGVEREQVKDEVEENWKLSGADERRQRRATARRVASRNQKLKGAVVVGTPDANAFFAKNLKTLKKERAGETDENVGLQAPGAGSDAPTANALLASLVEEESKRTRVGKDGEDVGDRALDPNAGSPAANQSLTSATGQDSKSKRADKEDEDVDHQAPPRPIEPFDPRPHGQPYAGTSLYVPGFRTYGTMSWQEWSQQHPHDGS